MHVSLFHMLHLLLGLLVAYAGLALIVIIMGLVMILILSVTIFKDCKRHKLFAVLAAAVLCTPSLHANTKPLTDKQYFNEVMGIVLADMDQIDAYQANPPAGTDALSVGIYCNLINLDLYLVAFELHRFKHHEGGTREQVDFKLAQLSRDLETVPQATVPR